MTLAAHKQTPESQPASRPSPRGACPCPLCRLNADQTQEDHAAFAGTYPGSKAQDHDTMSKVGSFKDVSKLAQEVRSLPPLVQRRMVVKTLQDPWSKKIQEEQKEHERMLEMQKQRKQQMKAEQKQYLDAQVARREEQKNLEKERMKLLAAEEAHQRAIWKEEAELSARRRKEDVNHLMQDLVHQRQNALMKKQHDLEEKKRDEAEKVRRLQQEIRIEEQEKLHKREKVSVCAARSGLRWPCTANPLLGPAIH